MRLSRPIYRSNPYARQGLLLAGNRPFRSARPTRVALGLGLLSHLQRVVDFHAEAWSGTLELGVTEEQLDCSQVLGALID